jgi:hypothetical protein
MESAAAAGLVVREDGEVAGTMWRHRRADHQTKCDITRTTCSDIRQARRRHGRIALLLFTHRTHAFLSRREVG